MTDRLDDLDNLHDEIAMEMDKRKLERLIESGEITREELAHARYYLTTPNCECELPPDNNDRCPKCLTKFTMEDITDDR